MGNVPWVDVEWNELVRPRCCTDVVRGGGGRGGEPGLLRPPLLLLLLPLPGLRFEVDVVVDEERNDGIDDMLLLITLLSSLLSVTPSLRPTPCRRSA